VSGAPIHGLVLAGGASSRMKRDKAMLIYQGKSQLDRAVEIARSCALPGNFDIRHSPQRHDELFVHEDLSRLCEKFEPG